MATLIEPPPSDTSKSAMENNLQLTQLIDVDPDLFTNTRPLWHPPGARGVYGGAVIAQCLSAAQRTVSPNFTIHSMHCYFVLAGKPDIPIIYHVEHVREGKSFATRTVQARQRGQPIFTVTLSFMRELDKGQKVVSHALCLPDVPGPKEDDSEAMRTNHGPFESQHIESGDNDSLSPHLKRTRMWIKTRGKISGGHEAHLNALAYMSDSFFIGTVARAHKLWRNFVPKAPPSVTGQKVAEVKSPIEIEIEKEMNEDMAKRIREMNGGTDDNKEKRNEIAMMVSLDHVIYFHLPREFRADEWLLSEMDTPWAGDGRGLVMQRIWTRDGRLIASCVQEGLVRLKQDAKSKL